MPPTSNRRRKSSPTRRKSSPTRRGSTVDRATIREVIRYPIKGFSGEPLAAGAPVHTAGGLPNDRRFALLNADVDSKLAQAWLHKSNFLCSFSHPELVNHHRTSFKDHELELHVENLGPPVPKFPQSFACRLATMKGRRALERYFTAARGAGVMLIDGGTTRQFGNTNVQAATSTPACLHLVNVATTDALSSAAGTPIDARRLRPNLILTGLDAWAEFGWVGKRIRVGSDVTLQVYKRTIRCGGIGLWGPGGRGDDEARQHRCGDDGAELDVPGLLAAHFPEHGPYCGVYAVVERGGTICPGDEVEVLADEPDEAAAAPRALVVRTVLWWVVFVCVHGLLSFYAVKALVHALS